MTTSNDVVKDMLVDWHDIKDLEKATGLSREGTKQVLKRLRHGGERILTKRNGYQMLYKLSTGKPKRGGNNMALGKGKMPAVYYVREALQHFPTPHVADRAKVQAAAQSLARTAGETFAMKRNDVANAMNKLSAMYNGKYTADDIKKYQEQWLAQPQNIGRRAKAASVQVVQTPNVQADAYSLNDFFELVKAARAFVQRAGGRSHAVQLIDVLQGD